MRQIKINQSITLRETRSLEIYLNDIKKYPMINSSEEVILAQKIKQGDLNARKKLFNGNLRFVVSVAKIYQGNGITLMDLIQEGNTGLWKASGVFDETKGFKFISFAVGPIKQYIMSSLNVNKSIVRLPSNKIELKNRINNAEGVYINLNERKPNLYELSEILGIPETKISEVSCLENTHRYVSLDQPIGDHEDEDYTLLNKISSDIEPTDSVASLINFSTHVCDVLKHICDEREFNILSLYFGLNNIEQKSISEIAILLDLSIERVSLIKNKTLRKLRVKKEVYSLNYI